MKSISYFRAVDELGRVVLPVSFRRNFNIQIKDNIEILVGDDCIYLRKYQPTCVFCGNTVELTKFKGKNICKACLAANSDIGVK